MRVTKKNNVEADNGLQFIGAVDMIFTLLNRDFILLSREVLS